MKTSNYIQTIITARDVNYDLCGKVVTIRTKSGDFTGIATGVVEPCRYNDFMFAEITLDHKNTYKIY